MKKIFSTTAAIVIIIFSYSQSGYTYELINSEPVRKLFGPITSDNSGNTIITGQFETTITLGAITLTNNNPSPGSYNTVFVAKKLPGGNFAWAKMLVPLSIPSSTSRAHVYGACTDAAGNVYLTGDFFGKIACDNVTISSTKNGSVYTPDIFTVKVSANGAVVWAKTAGTANDGCNAVELARSVATDNAGNVYVTGQIAYKAFKNTTVCHEINAPGCIDATTKTITCPYVIKYDAVGNKVWERKYGNDGALAGTSCWYNHPQGTDIRTDGTYIYVLGYFYGTVAFGSSTLSTGSETTSNIFLLKLDASGTVIWARSATGAGTNGYSVGDGLFVNGNDIYFRGILPLGAISLGGCSFSSASSKGFLAKVFANGNCSWIQPIWGISYGTVPHPNGNLAMLLRRSGGYYPLGGWYGIKELSPLDGSAVDSTEVPLADTTTGSSGGYPSIVGLPTGFVFSQTVSGTIHFADLTISSVGTEDMILIKYTAPTPAIANKSTIQAETVIKKISLYPNPASDQLTILNNNNKTLGNLSVYDASGKMIYKKSVENFQATIDVKKFPAGVYCIVSDQLQATIKFVKR